MENLKKIKPTKELWTKIKWIAKFSKPAIPFLIFSIIINVIFSLIGIYNVTVSKSLVDSAIAGNTDETIKWITIMLIITIINMLSSPITSFISMHSSMKLTQNIQRKIYQHLQCCDWLEQNKYHSVSLLTRVTGDVGNISSAILGTIPSLISIAVTFIGSFYTLLHWAPSLAFAALVVGPFLAIVGKYFSHKLKDIYKESQELDIKYRSFMQESIQNLMIVKTFCMEKFNMLKLINIQNEKYKMAVRNTKFSSATSLSMSFCSSFAYLSIYIWGILNIAKGVTSYGTFTAMLQLYSKVQSPFNSITSMIPGLIGTIAATERLMEIEAIPLEKMAVESDLDDDALKEIALDSVQANVTNIPEKIDIVFDNVCFGYKANHNILNNLDLTINSGETLALVGPSGQGKTTIIRLILSLINPTSGNVYIDEDGVLTENNRNFREIISYVPQGNTLFSGTIRSNLLYGKPNATDEELRAALTMACAIDFIDELEDGLETAIGEKGTGISEGQAQRIAIARAFLREKPILILDEATSALDPETEVDVLKAVKALPHKPTCIIITHRPSALNICSRIMKLEKGNIRQVTKESILDISNELV